MGCENLKNTGNTNPRCYKGPIVGGFFSERKFTLSKTNIVLQAQWETLILGDKPERVYPIFDKQDPAVTNQREPRAITSADGTIHYAGSTPLGVSFDINKPGYEEIRNKLIQGVGDADVYVMPITSEGFIIGKENSDGEIEAMNYQAYKNVLAAEAYGSVDKIRYMLVEKDPEGDLAKRYEVKPSDWSVFDKTGIVSVVLEQISCSATSLVLKATEAGSDGTIPISTLTTAAAADWKITGTGTISGATYSATTELYTIAGTNLTDDDVIEIAAPKTTLQKYEAESGLVLVVT